MIYRAIGGEAFFMALQRLIAEKYERINYSLMQIYGL
jgi:hypothetical protein